MRTSSNPNPVSPERSNRIAGLDELRGMAILLVIFAHFSGFRAIAPELANLHLGGIGVDLFFVVSGFLIGRILIRDVGTPDYFRRFYVRRAFRILPLYLVLVLGTFVLALLLGEESARSLPLYLLFLQNFLPSQGQSPELLHAVFEGFDPLPMMGPAWSLAVEEQFYLLAPLVACLFSRHGRLLALVVLMIIGAYLDLRYASSVVPSASLSYANPNEPWFNMQFLAFGFALNFANSGPLVAGFSGIYVFATLLNEPAATAFQGIIAVTVASAVALTASGTLVPRNAALAWTGVRVYGIYLLHIPVLVIFRAAEDVLSTLTEALPGWLEAVVHFGLYLGSTLLVGAASFRFFETPIQSYRTRFESSA